MVMYIDNLYDRSYFKDTISEFIRNEKNIHSKSNSPFEIQYKSYKVISFPTYYRNHPASKILDDMSIRNNNIAIRSYCSGIDYTAIALSSK